MFDSIGGAESYRVSVSCVGSPANVQGFDRVPAPQSQKNLRGLDQSCNGLDHFIYLFFKVLINIVLIMNDKTAGLTYHVV